MRLNLHRSPLLSKLVLLTAFSLPVNMLVAGETNVSTATSDVSDSGVANLGEQTLLLTGQISSVQSQSFMVPKAGDAWRYQIQWMLPEGSIAETGQTVVIFDKSQIANQIEQLEASLLRVTAQEQSLSIDLTASVLQAKFDVKQQESELEKSRLDADVPAKYIAAKA